MAIATRRLSFKLSQIQANRLERYFDDDACSKLTDVVLKSFALRPSGLKERNAPQTAFRLRGSNSLTPTIDPQRRPTDLYRAGVTLRPPPAFPSRGACMSFAGADQHVAASSA